MALIKCSECGREISDKAPACPSCGNPTSSKAQPAPPPPQFIPIQSAPQKPPKAKTSPAAWVALIAIIVGVIYFFQSPTYKEQNLPPLPVEVGYRSALLGPGLVLKVKNTSSRSLSIIGTFANPTTKQEQSFRMDIPPNGESELGHKEGWAFASGDTLKLSHNDYASWQGSIP